MKIFDIAGDRKDLALLFRGTGAEIGVERGAFAKRIFDRSPAVKLFCVDPWKAYDGYREHVPQERQDQFFRETRDRLAGYNVEYIRDYSIAAADRFKWGELDFVYIDANHEYEHVLEDVRAWAPKVRAGGIVSGHDYAGDVEKAVLEHCRQAGIPVLFVWRNDRSASWSFIQI
jgi:hypothetical protein